MNTNILLGTILGDASINEYGGFKFKHSLAQEDYAIWKAENLGLNLGCIRATEFDKRTNKTYSSITHYTRYETPLYYYRLLFYKPKKIVNAEILNLLNEEAIAIWYCDDGGLYYNSNVCHLSLAINSFENKTEIIDYFKKRWNINFKENQGFLRITSVKECIKFFDLFGGYMPKSMKYKTLNHAVEKYKEKKRNRPKIIKEYKCKKVIQYDLEMNFIKEWGGAKEASKILGIKGLYDCLSNRCKNKNNFIWKYKEEI